MREIEFTEQEANVLIELLDVAVKTKGLAVAQNALALTAKLQTAFAEQDVVEPEPELTEALDK